MNSWMPFLSNASGVLIAKPHITQMATEIKVLGPRMTFAEMLERKFGLTPSQPEDFDEIDEVDFIDDDLIEECANIIYAPDKPDSPPVIKLIDETGEVYGEMEIHTVAKAERVAAEPLPPSRLCLYNPIVIDSRIFRHVRLIEEKMAQTNWAKKMRYIRPAQFVLTGIVFIPREITADGAII